jgi:uncharacterized membrane protein YdbT with pleckstrin-like domain
MAACVASSSAEANDFHDFQGAQLELHPTGPAAGRNRPLSGKRELGAVLLPIGLVVVGVVAAAFGPVGWIVAALAFAIAAILALRAWFIRWTTEIAVTNLRVIYAQGFVQRRSVEIHMDKVESVDVDQSVLGRVLDYGTVTVRGTGATLEPFRDIDRPIDFRNQVVAT